MTLLPSTKRTHPAYFRLGLSAAAVFAAAFFCLGAYAQQPIIIGGSGLPSVEVDLGAIEGGGGAPAERRLLMPGTKPPPPGGIVLTPPGLKFGAAPKLIPPRSGVTIALRPPKLKPPAKPSKPPRVAAAPPPKPKPAVAPPTPPRVAAAPPLKPKPVAKPPEPPRAKKRIPVESLPLSAPPEPAVTEAAKAPPPPPPVAEKAPEPKPAPKTPAAPAPPPPPVAEKAPEPKPAPKTPAAPPPPIAEKAPEPKPAPKTPAEAAPPPPVAVAEKAPEPPPPVKKPVELGSVAPATEPDNGPQQLATLPRAIISIVPDKPTPITFAPGSAELGATEREALAAVADALNKDAGLRLQIVAYATGSDDNASQARRLSLSRALAVRSQLIDMGVRSTRMDVRALGNKFKTDPGDRVDLIVAEP